MRLSNRVLAFLLLVSIPSFADTNIEKMKFDFSLSEKNKANVVRLKNDNKIVTYILEVYIDAWEIDSPDDQLGGSLCIRLNKAGGEYSPGCLLCKKNALTTYEPIDCLGVFSKEMLEAAFTKSKRGNPIEFEGVGMRIFLKIQKLEFSDEPVPPQREKKIKRLEFEIEFIPDSTIPLFKEFTRKGLKE